MAITKSAFKRDELGDYVEMVVGETEDYANDISYQLTQDSDAISTPVVWEADVGITVSSPSVSGGKAQAFFTCTAVGTFWVKNKIPTTGNRLYIEKFRVIGKAY